MRQLTHLLTKSITLGAVKSDPLQICYGIQACQNMTVMHGKHLNVIHMVLTAQCVQVSLKLVDLLTLYGTTVGAVIGAGMAFWGANVELSYVLSTLGVLGGKLFQVSLLPVFLSFLSSFSFLILSTLDVLVRSCFVSHRIKYCIKLYSLRALRTRAAVFDYHDAVR